MHTVTIVVAGESGLFEFAIGMEVFGTDRAAMGLPNYEVLICTPDGAPARMTGGVVVQPDCGVEGLARADTVLVPAWSHRTTPPPAPLLMALGAAHARGARIASLCSGAFVLAAAGLLDGRRVTCHWMYAAELAAGHPDVDVDPDVLYVDGGDGIFTSAGTAAGVDLCLHLVRLDHGAHVANMFARRMVVSPHRAGGQAQYVKEPVPHAPGDHRLAATLDWALGNLHRPLTVDCLADHASQSPRTFARHFQTAVGTTPLRWLLRQRVAAAQRLLETTDRSVEEIAADCGFGSPASFRVHFSRQAGTTPSAYRATFRGRDLDRAV
jgi:AraC family transcriptional regulator, transcriptional activator FtrA